MNVWKTLSSINVNEHTERKGNLTYLSWAWAWAVTKQHYPEATYAFLDNEIHKDETMTVHCVVTIDNINHEMWLPVMDHRNNAVANPNAFQINTAKMRCLTKGLSMHGLGAYIYAGEDLPQAAPDPDAARDLYEAVLAKLNEDKPLEFLEYVCNMSDEDVTEAFNGAPKGHKTAFKDRYRAETGKANVMIADYCVDINNCVNEEDAIGVKEITNDLNPYIKGVVFNRFNPEQKEKLTALMTTLNTEGENNDE